MFPTRHAVERYQQRVAPVSAAEASRRIRAQAATAVATRRPRPWTPAAAAPGLMFLYPRDLPGVCFLVRDGAVLTVFERSIARAWEQGGWEPRHVRRTEPYHRPSPGSRLGEAA